MKFLIFFMSFLSSHLLAFSLIDDNTSAHRPLDVNFFYYEKKFLEENNNQKIIRNTPLNSARYFSEEINDSKIVGWRSLEDMQERFEIIRDARFLIDEEKPNFLRRISWLYPHDGCFIRAALFNRSAFRMFIPVPDKVFAFGNLRIKTNNSRRGIVGWWYHVAPIVQVGRVKYVLDPSIEAKAPLTLKQWLSKMGRPEKIKVAICSSGTNVPSEACDKETDGIESRAVTTQKHYLGLEELELKRLGRNTFKELGESPPWISN